MREALAGWQIGLFKIGIRQLAFFNVAQVVGGIHLRGKRRNCTTRNGTFVCDGNGMTLHDRLVSSNPAGGFSVRLRCQVIHDGRGMISGGGRLMLADRCFAENTCQDS